MKPFCELKVIKKSCFQKGRQAKDGGTSDACKGRSLVVRLPSVVFHSVYCQARRSSDDDAQRVVDPYSNCRITETTFPFTLTWAAGKNMSL